VGGFLEILDWDYKTEHTSEHHATELGDYSMKKSMPAKHKPAPQAIASGRTNKAYSYNTTMRLYIHSMHGINIEYSLCT